MRQVPAQPGTELTWTTRSSCDPWAALVGIPFVPGGRTAQGADCWGLHRLATLQLAGVELPSYAHLYADTSEVAANAALIAGHMADWRQVPAGTERALDCVLYRVGSYAGHVATVVRPGRMLHTYSGASSRVDYYRTGLFRERIVGFYRHKQLA